MDDIWQSGSVIAQTQIIARSLKHFTGRELLPEKFSPAELAEKVFHAPFVLVAHGIEADPVLNYGNAAALALWEMPWEELTRTPSRLTAEAPDREERARLLETVKIRGSLTIIPASAFPRPAGVSASRRRPCGTWFRRTENRAARRRCFRIGNFSEPAVLLLGFAPVFVV